MRNEEKSVRSEADNYIVEPIETVDGEIRLKKYIKLKMVGSGSYSKCYLVQNTDS